MKLLPPKSKSQRWFTVNVSFEGPYEIERQGVGFVPAVGVRDLHVTYGSSGWSRGIGVSMAMDIAAPSESEAVKLAISKVESMPEFYDGILRDADSASITIEQHSARTWG